MVRERRAFSNYPDNQKTVQNDRETFIADDLLFEPEKFDFLNGFIGDISRLSAEDLQRTPQIVERDAERQKYQLSIGATFIDPDTQDRVSGAFYTDVLRQISANGGITDDPNRLFSTDFYAWTPPIDYDKHINFSRYVWVGVGNAEVNGEYITKEPAHSKTTIYEFDGAAFIKRDVEIVNGLPAPGPDGTFVEDASTVDRFIYRSSGAAFVQIGFTVVGWAAAIRADSCQLFERPEGSGSRNGHNVTTPCRLMAVRSSTPIPSRANSCCKSGSTRNNSRSSLISISTVVSL